MDSNAISSISNALKELESLRKLIYSKHISYEDIPDCIDEVHWNLSNILSGDRYISDEFQQLAVKMGLDDFLEDCEVTMSIKNNYGDTCSSCGIWIQDTGDWYCEDCEEATCESCGLVEEEDGEFICKSCFSEEKTGDL